MWAEWPPREQQARGSDPLPGQSAQLQCSCILPQLRYKEISLPLQKLAVRLQGQRSPAYFSRCQTASECCDWWKRCFLYIPWPVWVLWLTSDYCICWGSPASGWYDLLLVTGVSHLPARQRHKSSNQWIIMMPHWRHCKRVAIFFPLTLYTVSSHSCLTISVFQTRFVIVFVGLAQRVLESSYSLLHLGDVFLW